MSAERDLAIEIHEALISDQAIRTALQLWDDLADAHPHERMGQMIGWLFVSVAREVLARRQSEAARAGPWDGTP